MSSAQNECVAGLQRRTISGIGAGKPTSKNAGLVPGGTACQFGFEQVLGGGVGEICIYGIKVLKV